MRREGRRVENYTEVVFWNRFNDDDDRRRPTLGGARRAALSKAAAATSVEEETPSAPFACARSRPGPEHFVGRGENTGTVSWPSRRSTGGGTIPC